MCSGSATLSAFDWNKRPESIDHHATRNGAGKAHIDLQRRAHEPKRQGLAASVCCRHASFPHVEIAVSRSYPAERILKVRKSDASATHLILLPYHSPKATTLVVKGFHIHMRVTNPWMYRSETSIFGLLAR